MRKIAVISIILMIAFIFAGCSDDDDYSLNSDPAAGYIKGSIANYYDGMPITVIFDTIRNVTVQSDGSFFIDDIPATTHQLAIRSDYFFDKLIPGIVVEENDTNTLDPIIMNDLYVDGIVEAVDVINPTNVVGFADLLDTTWIAPGGHLIVDMGENELIKDTTLSDFTVGISPNDSLGFEVDVSRFGSDYTQIDIFNFELGNPNYQLADIDLDEVRYVKIRVLESYEDPIAVLFVRAVDGDLADLK